MQQLTAGGPHRPVPSRHHLSELRRDCPPGQHGSPCRAQHEGSQRRWSRLLRIHPDGHKHAGASFTNDEPGTAVTAQVQLHLLWLLRAHRQYLDALAVPCRAVSNSAPISPVSARILNSAPGSFHPEIKHRQFTPTSTQETNTQCNQPWPTHSCGGLTHSCKQLRMQNEFYLCGLSQHRCIRMSYNRYRLFLQEA